MPGRPAIPRWELIENDRANDKIRFFMNAIDATFATEMLGGDQYRSDNWLYQRSEFASNLTNNTEFLLSEYRVVVEDEHNS
jgi:hypothetical protein